jgi:hypothetical protein
MVSFTDLKLKGDWIKFSVCFFIISFCRQMVPRRQQQLQTQTIHFYETLKWQQFSFFFISAVDKKVK